MNWQFNNGSLIKTKKLWSDFICKFKIRKSLSQVMEFTLLRTTNKELHKPENQALTEQCCFKLLIEHLFHLASFSSPLIEVNGIWNKGTNFSKLPARSTWLKKKKTDRQLFSFWTSYAIHMFKEWNSLLSKQKHSKKFFLSILSRLL